MKHQDIKTMTDMKIQGLRGLRMLALAAVCVACGALSSCGSDEPEEPKLEPIPKALTGQWTCQNEAVSLTFEFDTYRKCSGWGRIHEPEEHHYEWSYNYSVSGNKILCKGIVYVDEGMATRAQYGSETVFVLENDSTLTGGPIPGLVYTPGHGHQTGPTASPGCPDENHPHAIDLGYGGDVLWACCNVGASSPELAGDYFAWGDVRTRPSFPRIGYKWGENPQDVKDIGDDIAGTEYDAATANWGEEWFMPKLNQVWELMRNTTWHWTYQGGQQGMLITGKNGATIFMPAAGYKGDSQKPLMAGEAVMSWTATINSGNHYKAECTRFNDKGLWNTSLERRFGLTVRPVCARKK